MIILFRIINMFVLANHIQTFYLPALSQTLRSSSLLASKLLYDIEAWKKGYESCSEEICEVISSALPSDIEGTYFRYNAF